MADPQKIHRPLTRESVHKAHELIKPYIHLTPVMQCDTLSRIASTPQVLSITSSISPHTNGTALEAVHEPAAAFVDGNKTKETHISESSQTQQRDDSREPRSKKLTHPNMNLFFKCENYQKIGAFKARGAFHALSRLTDGELENGVITHSSGPF